MKPCPDPYSDADGFVAYAIGEGYFHLEVGKVYEIRCASSWSQVCNGWHTCCFDGVDKRKDILWFTNVGDGRCVGLVDLLDIKGADKFVDMGVFR